MKKLYIVRHAKSSWDNSKLEDIDRPIIEKGIKRTEKIIKFLKAEKIIVDMVLSSPAKRAFDTAKMIAKEFNYVPENIKIDKRIYSGDENDILNVIFEIPDCMESVVLVGHNPVLTDFVNIFLDKKIDNLPTTGTIGFTFDADHWNSIYNVSRKTDFVAFPKLLKTK